LAELLFDADVEVGVAGAKNPSLDPADLERVIYTVDENVRQALLARDDVGDHVRTAVALAL
jgi:hypothetical protein